MVIKLGIRINVNNFWRCENARASAFSIELEDDEIWSHKQVTFQPVVKLKICFGLGGCETKTVIRKNPSWRKRVKQAAHAN